VQLLIRAGKKQGTDGQGAEGALGDGIALHPDGGGGYATLESPESSHAVLKSKWILLDTDDIVITR
jgi:hypothetical protein